MQLMWMPSAGWRLVVVTAKAPIYASLPEGELFKVIKLYGLRAKAESGSAGSSPDGGDPR